MTVSLSALLRQAVAHHQSGRLAEAQAGYEAVLARNPLQPDALHLLGVLQDQMGRHEAAVALIQKAIVQSPDQAMFHGNLGTALLAANRAAEAEEAYRHAVTLDPDYVEGHYNLGNLLRRRGDVPAAREHLERAVSLAPNHVQARNNLAMLLWEDCADSVAAGEAFKCLLAQAPDWATAHMNHGVFLLAGGDFREGWAEYEWRWRSETYHERDWGCGLPRWNGEPLDGARLLLWGEQGIGDQILYGTMLRDARQFSRADLCIAVDKRLVGLFERSFADVRVRVIARGEQTDAVRQCPFASLGRWLRREEADFVDKGTYLVADTGRSRYLRQRYQQIAGEGKRLLGVSWRSGNSSIGQDKSIPLEQLLPALRQPDVFWISLQYGDTAAEITLLRERGIDIHQDETIDAFQDIDALAAQISALDGVVSVSNTTVHVAGALGVPCQLLLPLGRGRLWYWPAGGEAGRWYPSVRILRQERAGDWEAAVACLRTILSEHRL
ncbi:MAG TPA: tetratricopeptide repeat protein [Ferrovibrio sp.]|uniref:tetratricopeptide repeat protein n=1 Tax=Ferrovibrio sp. TaxID=1917215 RepID=UPI002ED0E13A